jgi:tetratricopeptide (TPR) repeat protein
MFLELGKSMDAAKALHAEARVAAEKTDYPRAVELYGKVLAALSTHPEREKTEIFQVYTNRARALTDLCRYGEAAQDLKRAEEVLAGRGNPRQQARLDTLKGLLHFELQEYEESLSAYRSALKIRKKTGDLKGLAVALNNIGLVRESQSKFDDAIANYIQSLKLSRRFHDPGTQAFALNNLGSVYFKIGDYKTSREMYDKALLIRKSRGIANYTANTLNNLGILDFYSGDYRSADRRFRDALRKCRQARSPLIEGWILIDVGMISKERGEFPKARASFETAIKLGKKIQNGKLEAHARLRMGNLLEYLGAFDEALAEYKKAVTGQKRIGTRLWESNTLADMAGVLTRSGLLDAAETTYRQALKLKREIRVPTCDLLCRFALFQLEKRRYEREERSGAEERTRDLAEAGRLIEEAEARIEPEAKKDLILLTYVKGRYLLDTDPSRAVSQFQALSRLAETTGSGRFSFLASVGLGLAYESLGRLSEAADAFETAVDYAERIRDSLTERDKRTFLHGEEILGVKHVLPYEALAGVRMKLGRPEEALKESEFTKARSFSENLAGKTAVGVAGVPPEVVGKDLELNRKLAAILRQVEKARESGAKDVLNSAAALAARLRKKFTAHIDRLRRYYPRFAAAKYPKPRDLSGTALRDDEWTLSYDVTDRGLIGYLTKGKRLVKTWFNPITRRELDGLVARFRKPMENVCRDNFLKKLGSFDLVTARKLADVLLGEILTELPPGVPIIIAPDDSLGILPFGALALNSGGKIITRDGIPQVSGVEFFDARNPVSYCQSLNALTLSRIYGKKRLPGRKLLVMADPVFRMRDSRLQGKRDKIRTAGAKIRSMIPVEDAAQEYLSFDRLPETGRLARELGLLFKNRADIFTGLDATKKRLLGPLADRLTRYDKIVFATHAFFGLEVPGIVEPVLVFARVPPGTDGYLRMSEVTGLRMNADMVALTACQTGLGRRISGEGTMGMGRAFRFAGARTVLMSLWSAAEFASVELVKDFLLRLKEGKSKLEALQSAKDKLRKSGFDHPFFTEAFILMGEVSSSRRSW